MKRKGSGMGRFWRIYEGVEKKIGGYSLSDL